MRKIRALIFVFLLFSCSARQTLHENGLNYASRKAKIEDKFLLLHFTSETDSRCGLLNRDIFENEKYTDFFNTNFVIHTAKEGENDFSKLKERFSVRETPTVIILDKLDNEKNRITGYTSPPETVIEELSKPLKGREIFYKGTIEDAFEESKKENKPLLVYFYRI